MYTFFSMVLCLCKLYQWRLYLCELQRVGFVTNTSLIQCKSINSKIQLRQQKNPTPNTDPWEDCIFLTWMVDLYGKISIGKLVPFVPWIRHENLFRPSSPSRINRSSFRDHIAWNLTLKLGVGGKAS